MQKYPPRTAVRNVDRRLDGQFGCQCFDEFFIGAISLSAGNNVTFSSAGDVTSTSGMFQSWPPTESSLKTQIH